MTMSKSGVDRIELAMHIMLSYGIEEDTIAMLVGLITNAICDEVRIKLDRLRRQAEQELERKQEQERKLQ